MLTWRNASAVVVLTLFARTETFGACPAFTPAPVLTAGGNPASVAVGDFNGDGKTDLAVANGSGHTVSLFLGKGDGTFQPRTDYKAAGEAPISVAVGDFNCDGKSDVVVASYHPNLNSVAVLLGKGTGVLEPARPYLGGTTPTYVAVGDLNGDCKSDVAVLAVPLPKGPRKVSILKGDAAGALLDTSTNFAVGPNPYAIATGDLNRDGKVDLVVANYTRGSDPGSVSILLGVGNGTFLPATQYAEANAIGVAVGDLSGDGIADVVVAKSTNLKNVAVLLGKGDGSFNSAVPYSAGTSPIAVAIADFDRDGKNDVAIANQMSNSISVYRGIGSGTLGAPLTYASDPTNAISRPDSVVVGDFNGDGKSDLAVANDVSNHVTIFLNTCTCPP